MVSIGIGIFIAGFASFLANKKSFITVLVAVEVMLLAIISIAIGFSGATDLFEAQYFSFFTMAVAASESAVGLALLVQFYRVRGRIDSDVRFHLKG